MRTLYGIATVGCVVLVLAQVAAAEREQGTRAAPPKPVSKAAPAPAFFENPFPIEELRNKQAVIETTAGTIVIDLLAEEAPNHVALFVKTARDGGYDGTTF